MSIWEAEIFVVRADAGRSRPPLIVASNADRRAELFVKFPRLHQGLSVEKLACEWIAAALAKRLQLPVAEPYVVNLSERFVSSLEQELRGLIPAGPCLAFGSENLGPQWHIWHGGASLPLKQLPLQLSVYVFDTLVQNWDRSVGNPNLLKRGDAIAILDHEETFQPWVEPLDRQHPRPFPWRPNGITNSFPGDTQHVFWATLWTHRKKLDVDAALEPWKSLSKDDILSYGDQIPDSWDEDATLRVLEYLSQVVDNVDNFRDHLKATLTDA